MTNYKTCKQCGKEKKISEFYKYRRSKDNHFSICKECQRHNRLEERGYTYNKITGEYYKFIACKKCGIPFVYNMKKFSRMPKYCRNCR